MILTCPRCATRYLADPLHVWTTGRTVQCEACGQRWRAVGQGARPGPTAESPPVGEPSPDGPEAAAPGFEVSSGGETVPVPDESETYSPIAHEPPPVATDESAHAETAAAVETRPATEPVYGAPAPGPEWFAALTPSPAPSPDTEETDEPAMTREFLFRKQPAPLTSSFGSRGSGAGRWLAIAFLVVIALAAFVMFRDVIVQVLPSLAPIYAAMGLLVHPVAGPHG